MGRINGLQSWHWAPLVKWMRRLSEWTAHPLPLHRECAPAQRFCSQGRAHRGWRRSPLLTSPWSWRPLLVSRWSVCRMLISPTGLGATWGADLYQLTSSLAAFNKKGKIRTYKMTFIFSYLEWAWWEDSHAWQSSSVMSSGLSHSFLSPLPFSIPPSFLKFFPSS